MNSKEKEFSDFVDRLRSLNAPVSASVQWHGWSAAWEHQQAEIDALKHDIERHVALAAEQAQRIVALEEAQRWIPVSERLPDKGQHVITFSGDMLLPFNVDYLTVRHKWFFQEGLQTPVTHWMPLPEPPEAGE